MWPPGRLLEHVQKWLFLPKHCPKNDTYFLLEKGKLWTHFLGKGWSLRREGSLTGGGEGEGDTWTVPWTTGAVHVHSSSALASSLGQAPELSRDWGGGCTEQNGAPPRACSREVPC